jgi:molybdate transport repressor ModE-like protein
MARKTLKTADEEAPTELLRKRLSHLRVRHLELLDQIEKRGSLSAAAAHIGVSQPRSTIMLREMEDAVGRPLLQRSAKGGYLNAAGQVALSRLRVALGALATFQQSMRDAEPRPILRIGMPPVVGSDIFCTVIADLDANGQLPQLSIRAGNIGQLLALLLAGEVDCVLSSLDSGGPSHHDEQRLNIAQLWDEHFHVVAAADHPVLRKRRVSLRDALLHPWVAMPTMSANRQSLERMFLTAGLPPPQPIVETESPHVAMALVARSRMLALVAESAFRQANGMVGRVRLEHDFHPTKINLISLADVPRSPVVDELASRLRQAAHSLPRVVRQVRA